MNDDVYKRIKASLDAKSCQESQHDCFYCIRRTECGVEDWKDHAYNLRDGTDDCFIPREDIIVPPWFDPRTECYRCMKHTYEDCMKCMK